MNILFIVCDTLRYDHLGCYGYFRDTSPNIDAIAKEGAVLEDFYNSGAPTGPGFTCIYTGLHTINHKYYQFIQANIRQVNDLIFTMPEILKASGLTTVAIDNLINFNSHSKHWARGYDYYINPGQRASSFPPTLKAEHVTESLVPWIKEHSSEDFFLFAHYWDPHLEYTQPEKYRNVFHHKKGDLEDLKVEKASAGYEYVPGWGRIGYITEESRHRGKDISIDLYDGEIMYMDDEIGKAISTLEDEGIYDETLTILTSDHGEHLGQHYNGFWHHNSLHDTIVHVPFIIRFPKEIPKGIRINGFAQHIDVLPTILDLFDVPTEKIQTDGESFMPLFKKKLIRKNLFMEHVSLQRAIRTERWKIIDDLMRKTTELYDLKNDPLETENLSQIEKDTESVLRKILNRTVKSYLEDGQKDPIQYDMRTDFDSGINLHQ